ncbi:MAG: tyrosine-type recombinase/integrase, partial [Bacteroidetes bacterium]|nr:tyrosine-type recombinase/integrase [Bacteroidota bacterium]
MKSLIVRCENTSDLIENVKEELSKYGYKAKTIHVYQRYWNALLKYETANGIRTYSPKHGLDFLKAVYGISVFSALSKQDKVRARSITLLNDYSRDRMLFPSVGCPSAVSFLCYFCQTLEAFKKHRANKYQISNTTLSRYNKYLGQFFLYLERHSINSLDQLNPSIILNYCSSQSPYSLSTLYNSFCSLRVFFRYLKNEGLLEVDYSDLVPSVHYNRASKIPSTFTKDEADRILQTIDRSNPIGKRDYIIILIAYRLGLRSVDIRNLRFAEIHWERNTIELKMKKTGKSIVLPLLEDVGQALIDYIKFGRPISESNIVFLRHISPIKAISASGMTAIVKRWANKAGINCAPGHSRGPHAMRS